MDGFHFAVAIEWLFKYVAGNTLLFFTVSPFAYIAERSKGLVVPMIVSAIVLMGSAALSNQELGALYPWTATYFFMQGRTQSTGYPISLSAGIIVFVSVIGFLATFQHFKKEDLK